MQYNTPADNAASHNAPRSQPSTTSQLGQAQHAAPALPSQPSSRMSGPVLKRKRSRQDSPDAQGRPLPSKTIASSDSADQDPDKKKSKLGYQRSTIACVHCRRRKIRCVIPDNDRSGKCAHCIRMKKQCSFVPVDSAGADKKRRPETLRKAMSEPSPVHTPYDASKDTSSLYHFDFGRPTSTRQGMVPSSYVGGSVQTTASYSDVLLSYQDVDPLTIPQTMPQSTNLQGQEMSSFTHHWTGLEQPLHTFLPDQTWSASPPPVMDRQYAASLNERRSNTIPASYSPFSGTTVGEGFRSIVPRAAFSPRSMSQPHSFYYTDSLTSNIARNRGHTISMPPLVPTPSFEVPSIETSQDMPGEPMAEPSLDRAFDKTRLQASNPSAYLSPLTSTSDPSTSHPSVSPVPPRDTYLSPPTSEPTLELTGDPTLPSLPTYVADEYMQRYYLQQSWDTASGNPLPQEQMSPAIGEGLGLYEAGRSNFDDRQAVFGETQAVFDDRQAEFEDQQALFADRRTSLHEGHTAFDELQAGSDPVKAQMLDQQQVYDSMFAMSTGQGQGQGGFATTSMPEQQDSYFEPR